MQRTTTKRATRTSTLRVPPRTTRVTRSRSALKGQKASSGSPARRRRVGLRKRRGELQGQVRRRRRNRVKLRRRASLATEATNLNQQPTRGTLHLQLRAAATPMPTRSSRPPLALPFPPLRPAQAPPTLHPTSLPPPRAKPSSACPARSSSPSPAAQRSRSFSSSPSALFARADRVGRVLARGRRVAQRRTRARVIRKASRTSRAGPTTEPGAKSAKVRSRSIRSFAGLPCTELARHSAFACAFTFLDGEAAAFGGRGCKGHDAKREGATERVVEEHKLLVSLASAQRVRPRENLSTMCASGSTPGMRRRTC